MSPRVFVAGLGPAGRIVAHRAASRGFDVTAFDPDAGRMPSTVGLWRDQIPAWAPTNLVASTFRPQIVLADGSSRTLDLEYSVIDTDVLAQLGGFAVRREKWVPDRTCENGSDVAPDIIIDATNAGPHEPIRQIAFGQIFPESAIPLRHRVAVLMDFTEPMKQPGNGENSPIVPTFSYRIPLGNGLWLIEETILAIAIAGEGTRLSGVTEKQCLDYLRRRQSARLEQLGIDDVQDVETEQRREEIVSFPMVPRHRVGAAMVDSMVDSVGAKIVKFGAGGGWMHPATGYSVGASLADTDNFINLLLAGRSGKPPGGWMLSQLRRRGLSVILSFSADELATFFSAFFSLREAEIYTYLASPRRKNIVWATLLMMARIAVPLGRKSPRTLAKLLVEFARGQ